MQNSCFFRKAALLGFAALGAGRPLVGVQPGPAVAGPAARLRFAPPSLGGGLVAKSGQLRGFAGAGADQQFHWATARLVGPEVVVESPEVPHPVAVRYDWADNPDGTRYNRAGLPAPPFRPDAWAQ